MGTISQDSTATIAAGPSGNLTLNFAKQLFTFINTMSACQDSQPGQARPARMSEWVKFRMHTEWGDGTRETCYFLRCCCYARKLWHLTMNEMCGDDVRTVQHKPPFGLGYIALRGGWVQHTTDGGSGCVWWMCFACVFQGSVATV